MITNYVNGKIYVDSQTFAQAFSIDGNKFIALGSNEEIMSTTCHETIDLKGKTVLPGLNDSHLHLYMTGNKFQQVDLFGTENIDQIIARGKDYLKKSEGANSCSFLYGLGWNHDFFTSGEKRLLTKDDLDQISTEIPIIFLRVCAHLATANSKALQLLGVTENTIVDGGEILKDENGKLNGIFTENAIAYLNNILPKDTEKEIEEKMLNAMDYAISHGITSVQSCDFLADNYRELFPIVQNIYKEKKSYLRYYPQFNFQNIDDLYDYIDNYYTANVYDDFFQRGCLKLFKDGSLGARTALLRQPYADDPTTSGVSALSKSQVDDFCNYAKANNIRIITHAIGDLAIEEMIDSYEKIIVNNNELRHGIVHCQITDLPLLERISNLNINVMFQPIFLDYDITMIERRVGAKLGSTSYAFNTLYKLGAHTSHGTDSPVEDLNPFPNIHCAVTRQRQNGFPDGGFFPKEKMSIVDVIDNYTIESAYSEGTELYKGRIKPGYLADFIVLDKDIFTIPQDEIKNITVESTFIDGTLVYSK